MKKIIDKKENELFTKCDCGCGQQILAIDIKDGRCEINTRIDGRRKWTGVIINRKDINKLQYFLNNFAND